MDICARYYSPRNRLRTGPTDHGRLVGKTYRGAGAADRVRTFSVWCVIRSELVNAARPFGYFANSMDRARAVADSYAQKATIAVEPLYAPLNAHRDAASSLASANS